jgi:hypothetical protein
MTANTDFYCDCVSAPSNASPNGFYPNNPGAHPQSGSLGPMYGNNVQSMQSPIQGTVFLSLFIYLLFSPIFTIAHSFSIFTFLHSAILQFCGSCGSSSWILPGHCSGMRSRTQTCSVRPRPIEALPWELLGTHRAATSRAALTLGMLPNPPVQALFFGLFLGPTCYDSASGIKCNIRHPRAISPHRHDTTLRWAQIVLVLIQSLSYSSLTLCCLFSFVLRRRYVYGC